MLDYRKSALVLAVAASLTLGVAATASAFSFSAHESIPAKMAELVAAISASPTSHTVPVTVTVPQRLLSSRVAGNQRMALVVAKNGKFFFAAIPVASGDLESPGCGCASFAPAPTTVSGLRPSFHATAFGGQNFRH